MHRRCRLQLVSGLQRVRCFEPTFRQSVSPFAEGTRFLCIWVNVGRPKRSEAWENIPYLLVACLRFQVCGVGLKKIFILYQSEIYLWINHHRMMWSTKNSHHGLNASNATVWCSVWREKKCIYWKIKFDNCSDHITYKLIIIILNKWII